MGGAELIGVTPRTLQALPLAPIAPHLKCVRVDAFFPEHARPPVRERGTTYRPPSPRWEPTG